MRKILFLSILLLATTCLAQSGPDTLWTRTFSEAEYADDIIPVDDGYVVTGRTCGLYTQPPGQMPKRFLAKLTSAGETIWATTCEEQGSIDAPSLPPPCHEEFGENIDRLANQILTRWNSLWDVYRGAQTHRQAQQVIRTSDGGWLLSGATWPGDVPGANSQPDMFLTKLDNTEHELWNKYISTNRTGCIHALRPTKDGGCLAVGEISTTKSRSDTDIYAIRVTGKGDTLWTWQGGSNRHDAGKDIAFCDDGSCAVLVYISPSSDEEELYLGMVKLSENGNILELNRYARNRPIEPKCILRTRDGGFLLAGSYLKLPLEWIVLVRTDKNGKELWSRQYIGAYNSAPLKAIEIADGGYLIVGSIGGKFGVLRLAKEL
jgi:hypothetical protein